MRKIRIYTKYALLSNVHIHRISFTPKKPALYILSTFCMQYIVMSTMNGSLELWQARTSSMMSRVQNSSLETSSKKLRDSAVSVPCHYCNYCYYCNNFLGPSFLLSRLGPAACSCIASSSKFIH